MYQVHLRAEFSIAEANALKIFCKKLRISMLEEFVSNEEAHEIFTVASKIREELKNNIPPVDVMRDFKLLSKLDNDRNWDLVALDVYISSSQASAFSKYLRKVQLEDYEKFFDKKSTAKNMSVASWTLKSALDFVGKNIDLPQEEPSKIRKF